MDRSLKSRRKLWLKVHLYLGLFAGAVFVLIGLTGSLLAFEHPLDEWLNAEMMIVAEEGKPPLPLDTLLKAGMNAVPTGSKIDAIGFPQHSGLAYDLWFEQPSPNTTRVESHQLFVNPYTGEVTGQRLKVDFERGWRGSLMDVILRLHYSLAVGDVGMTVIGFIGLALVFSMLTGIILWSPNKGQFKKALTIKRHASVERFVFDLHKVLGFYSAVILLFLILSGVYLIFPDYGRALISIFSPVAEPYPVYYSTPPQGDKTPLNLAQITAIADARFPDGQYRWIVLPKTERGVYQVGKRASDEINPRHAYRTLWLDQYSGNILHERTANTRTAGDIFVEWLYPLHTGEAFGLTGRLIILVSGLIPLLLYVTGVIWWLQKQGKCPAL